MSPSGSDDRTHHLVLWMLGLGVGFAAAVVIFMISLVLWADSQHDAERRINMVDCLRAAVLDERFCDALQKAERQQFGAPITECPFRDLYPDLFDCDFYGLGDPIGVE